MPPVSCVVKKEKRGGNTCATNGEAKINYSQPFLCKPEHPWRHRSAARSVRSESGIIRLHRELVQQRKPHEMILLVVYYHVKASDFVGLDGVLREDLKGTWEWRG